MRTPNPHVKPLPGIVLAAAVVALLLIGVVWYFVEETE